MSNKKYMIRKILLLTTLMGGSSMLYSQGSIYTSVEENAENGMTFSHVVGGLANMESLDGRISTGSLFQYQYEITTTTGTELVDVALLSVYPNPTKDILILKTGELKNVTMILSNAEGKQLKMTDILEYETSIDFSSYGEGVYYLSLIQNNTKIKSFSIIKK